MEQSLTLWISENGKMGHFNKTGCTLLATLKKKMNCKCSLKIELNRKFKTEQNTKKIKLHFFTFIKYHDQRWNRGPYSPYRQKKHNRKGIYFPN